MVSTVAVALDWATASRRLSRPSDESRVSDAAVTTRAAISGLFRLPSMNGRLVARTLRLHRCPASGDWAATALRGQSGRPMAHCLQPWFRRDQFSLKAGKRSLWATARCAGCWSPCAGDRFWNDDQLGVRCSEHEVRRRQARSDIAVELYPELGRRVGVGVALDDGVRTGGKPSQVA